ncbi:MAG: hypothetical protein HY059_13610 [Proteobacteria bacterium]|nr:hypothetical protein [Pseudomonadota bacterium]
MTGDDLVAAYDEALSRLAAQTPEPGPARRLIDPFLRLFGADSRTFAVAERSRALDHAARRAVAAGDPAVSLELDAALRRRAAVPVRAPS